MIKPFKESFSGGKSDVKTGKRFFDLGNFNVKGHNITRFANYDKDKCENECLYRNHCHGFFIHNDGTCYLKHSGMYPNNLRIASDDGRLYMRSTNVGNAASTDVTHQTSSSQWQLYPACLLYTSPSPRD